MDNAPTQNTTGPTYVEPQYSSFSWIFLQTVTCLLSVIQVYILISLIRHEYMVRIRKNDFHAAKYASTRRGSVAPTTQRDTHRAWLNRLTILASMSALFKLLTNQIDLFLGSKSNEACQVLGYTAVAGYGGSLCFIYLVLWLRQASLQSLKVLNHLPGKKIRVFSSRALLVVMILTFLTLFVLNFITMSLSASPQGCVFTDLGKLSQSARSSAGLIFTLLFQPAFALLLLFPLLKKLPHQQNRASSKSEAFSKNVTRVHNLIKRCLISLLVITVTDAVTIVASFKMEELPVIMLSVVYDVNACIGVVSILLSFGDWKRRLNVCAAQPNPNTLQRSVTST